MPTVQCRSDIVAVISPNQMRWWPSEQWHSSSHQRSKLGSDFSMTAPGCHGWNETCHFQTQEQAMISTLILSGSDWTFGLKNETHTRTLLHTIKSVSDCWPLILCDGFAASYLTMSWEVHAALLAATSCTGAGGGIISAGPEMLIKLLCNYQKRRSL